MTISPFGLIVVLVGLLSLLSGRGVLMGLAFAMCSLGSAEAIGVPALGGATVLPPQLFLLFLVAWPLVHMRSTVSYALDNLLVNPTTAWFAALMTYGIFSIVFNVNLFHGTLEVFSPARSLSVYGNTPLVPLQFSSANVTQTVYALGNFATYLAVQAVIRGPRDHRHVVRGMLVLAGLNLVFAVADYATFLAGRPDLLGFLRSASYAQLFEHTVVGIKRISGSFPESSAFAIFSIPLFVVCLTLWSHRIHPRVSGALALGQLAALLLATSTTGYVALLGCLTMLLLLSAVRLHRSRGAARLVTVVLVGTAVAVLAAVAVYVFVPTVAETVDAILQRVLFNKLQTASAAERGWWNRQAFDAFVGSMGLGVGLGSSVASSFPLVLLSNLGVIGFVCFAMMLVTAIRAPLPTDAPAHTVAAIRAARLGAVGMLVAASVSARVYDLGMLFYLLLGVAAPSTRIWARRRPAPVPPVGYGAVRPARPLLGAPRDPLAGPVERVPPR